MKTNGLIISRGRGPEIAGTRITIYDVLDWVLEGWHHTRIAAFFRISSDQVQAAMKYIQDHKAAVMADYAKILDRCARGNPPELRARLEKCHGRARERLKPQRRLKVRVSDNGGARRGQ